MLMVTDPLPPADVSEAPPFVASENTLPLGPVLPPPRCCPGNCVSKEASHHSVLRAISGIQSQW
jgi:hypothetical protein